MQDSQGKIKVIFRKNVSIPKDTLINFSKNNFSGMFAASDSGVGLQPYIVS